MVKQMDLRTRSGSRGYAEAKRPVINVEAFDDFGFQEALCPPVADAPIIS